MIPRSRTGRWSLMLMALAGIWIAAFFGLVISGQKGGDTFFSNPWLAATMTAATACAVAAAGTGLYSVVRERERSPAVFISTTLGLLVVAYGIAEVALPH